MTMVCSTTESSTQTDPFVVSSLNCQDGGSRLLNHSVACQTDIDGGITEEQVFNRLPVESRQESTALGKEAESTDKEINVHQPFMASCLGRAAEEGLYSQDKETEEEQLRRVARREFEAENQIKPSPSPEKRKRRRLSAATDSEEDEEIVGRRNKNRKVESDSEEADINLPSPEPVKESSRQAVVRRTAAGSAFVDSFQQESGGGAS